jgi:NitT/TauT family transport system substrate-binding protein
VSSVVQRESVVISPNGALFDLPEIVALEHGLFADAGLDVTFAQDRSLREGETEERPFDRLKEALFERGAADVFNLCEWGGIDRLERGGRERQISYLRPTVAAQALVTFDPELNEIHDLNRVPIGINSFTGSHYTALHLLEGTIPRDEIVLTHIGAPALRYDQVRSGAVPAVMLMEPFISLALKQGGKILGSYFYRGVEVIAPHLADEQRHRFVDVLNRAVDLINADPDVHREHIVARVDLAPEELRHDYYRYTHVQEFSEKRFIESYAWMKSWQLSAGTVDFENLYAPRD